MATREEFQENLKSTVELAKTNTQPISEVHILMIGKPGVGKSTLADAFIGVNECSKEARRDKAIESFSHQIGSVKVVCYDTQGLFDGEKEADEIVAEIQSKSPPSGFNIIIVCMKFHDRFDKSNREVFQVVNKLQNDVWSKVCVALTFADNIPANWKDYKTEEQETNFIDTKQSWKDDIEKYLVSKGIRKQGDPHLPIYPTTYTGSEPDCFKKLLRTWLLHFVVGVMKHSIPNSAHEVALYLAMIHPQWCKKVGVALLKVSGCSPLPTSPESIQDMVNTFVARGEEGYDKLIDVIDSLTEEEIDTFHFEVTESMLLKIVEALKQVVGREVLTGGALTIVAGVTGAMFVGTGVGAIAALATGVGYAAYKHFQ